MIKINRRTGRTRTARLNPFRCSFMSGSRLPHQNSLGQSRDVPLLLLFPFRFMGTKTAFLPLIFERWTFMIRIKSRNAAASYTPWAMNFILFSNLLVASAADFSVRTPGDQFAFQINGVD